MNRVVSLQSFDLPEKAGDDCADAFQRAFDSGCERILVPQREYLVSHTLEISGNTSVIFEGTAKISALPHFDGPLFRNRKACSHISICGGFYVSENEIFRFDGVNELNIEKCSVTNTAGNFITCKNTSDFAIRNLRLSRFAKGGGGNGICLSGKCAGGKISEVKFITEETFDGNVISLASGGEMRRIEINDIAAIGCNCFVAANAVDGITDGLYIHDVAGGTCCAAKLCGLFYNVKIQDFEIFAIGENTGGLMSFNGKFHGFEIQKFRRPGLLDCDGGENSPTLCFSPDGNYEASFAYLAVEQMENIAKSSTLSAVATYIYGGKPALDCLAKQGDFLCVKSGGIRKLTIQKR